MGSITEIIYNSHSAYNTQSSSVTKTFEARTTRLVLQGEIKLSITIIQVSIKRFLKRNLPHVGMVQCMNALADKVEK